VDRCRLDAAVLAVSLARLYSHALPKPFPKIEFNLVGTDIGQGACLEGPLQMPDTSDIRPVCARFAYGRLRIVLKKEVRPFAKGETFTFANDLQSVAVPGFEPSPQYPLGFLPVVREGRFSLTLASSIAVANPPEPGTFAGIDNTVVHYGSTDSPSAV
jgi:hypothetical protein